MKFSILIISLTICFSLIVPWFLTDNTVGNVVQPGANRVALQTNSTAPQAPQWLTIEGLVENPLNLTYTELRTFPMVSEVATQQCVGAGNGGLTTSTANFTGVPLFYILSMAKMTPGTYRKVVFTAYDSYTSDLPLEIAMDPTTILAFYANGTDIEQVSRDWYKFTPGSRLVLPGRWGYKWVRWVTQIKVVDYNYLGPWDRWWGDAAIKPNFTLPQTNPSVQHFGVMISDDLQVLTNSSLQSFKINSNWRMVFNVTGPGGTHGYFYVTFLKGLLGNVSRISADNNSVDYSQTIGYYKLYVFFTYSHSMHTIEIDWNLTPEADSGGAHALII